MRVMTTTFIGAALLASVAIFPAYAMPLMDQHGGMQNQNVEQVAVHCGPHAHYIRGHRDKHRHYVKGRCVRDRHR